MKHSENYNLNLPEKADQFNIDDWNENTNIIDSELKKEADNRQSGDYLLLQKINQEANNRQSGDEEAKELSNAIGILAFENGGTGASTKEDACKNLTTASRLNMAPEADLPDNYPEGVMAYIETPDSNLPYKPSDYGIILSIKTHAEVSQFWFTQPNGQIFHRGGNAGGWNASSAVPINRGWVPINSNIVAVATIG